MQEATHEASYRTLTPNLTTRASDSPDLGSPMLLRPPIRSQEIERHIIKNATRGLQLVLRGIAYEEDIWGQQTLSGYSRTARE